MSMDLGKVHEVITPTCKNGYLINLAPAMSIWHDGSPTEDSTPVTAATVQVEAGGNIAFTINGAADTRVTASTGIYVVTGLTAVAIYRHINAIQGWNLRLEGLRGADDIDNTLGTLAATNCFKTIAQPLIATADLDIHGLCISGRKYPMGGRQIGGSKLRAIEDEHGAINKLYHLWIAVTDATAGSASISIYSVKGAESTDEKLIFKTLPSASGAQTDLDFSSCPICAEVGHRLLIQYIAGGNLSAIPECFVNGKSVVIR